MNEIAQLTDLFSVEEGLNFNTGRAARMGPSGKPAGALRTTRKPLGVKKGHQVVARAKSVV